MKATRLRSARQTFTERWG